MLLIDLQLQHTDPVLLVLPLSTLLHLGRVVDGGGHSGHESRRGCTGAGVGRAGPGGRGLAGAVGGSSAAHRLNGVGKLPEKKNTNNKVISNVMSRFTY